MAEKSERVFRSDAAATAPHGEPLGARETGGKRDEDLPVRAQDCMDVLAVLPTEVALRGLMWLLRSLPCVGTAQGCSETREATRLLEEEAFHVAVLDACCGDEFDLISATANERGTQTLVLLRDTSRQAVAQAATLPADGFLLEPGLDQGTLENALMLLHRGEMPLPSSLAQRLISHLRRRGRPTAGPIMLTPRELQTLGLLADGLSNRQISRRLSISEHGVKRHVANILAKLNCPNRTLAVAYALREGLLEREGPG